MGGGEGGGGGPYAEIAMGKVLICDCCDSALRRWRLNQADVTVGPGGLSQAKSSRAMDTCSQRYIAGILREGMLSMLDEALSMLHTAS